MLSKSALIACADNPKLRHFVGTGVLQKKLCDLRIEEQKNPKEPNSTNAMHLLGLTRRYAIHGELTHRKKRGKKQSELYAN